MRVRSARWSALAVLLAGLSGQLSDAQAQALVGEFSIHTSLVWSLSSD